MSDNRGNAVDFAEWKNEYGSRISQAITQLSEQRRIAILFAIGLITAIEMSNRFAINVLLPDMQGNVAGSSDDLSWVVILYNLGFLASMATSFWTTRVIGARRHLLLNVGLYAAGAIGCFASAHSLTTLLISRVLMGCGGGAFLVRTIILIRLMYTGKARAFALTVLYVQLGVCEVFYPPAMGWFSDSLLWNYAFLIDFPFLAIGTYLIWKYLPKGYLYVRSEKSYVDWHGAGLLIVALGAMQIALSRGERDLWLESPFILASLLVAIACFAAYLWWDLRPENPAPVLHLQTIWHNGPLQSALPVVMIVGAIQGAGPYVLPQYLRNVQDFSSAQTGCFISSYTAGLALSMIFTLRWLLPRFGARISVALGAIGTGATCLYLIYALTPTTPSWLLALLTFVQGFTLAPLALGSVNIATGTASFEDLNDIATTYFFVRQLGNTFGVTAATVVFDRRQTLHSARLLDAANRLNPTLQATLSQYSALVGRNGGAGVDPGLGALQIFESNASIQARLLAYIDVYLGLVVLSVVVLLLVIFSRSKKPASPSVDVFHLR